MDIEYDMSQNSVYIRTASSHIRISNDFRVILINDEIHFIKPGADIYNYAEYAILKWRSNSEGSIPTSNVTYINADKVKTHFETYRKNIDTKHSIIPTLLILAQDIQIDNTSDKNLFAKPADFFIRIKQNQYNLKMTRIEDVEDDDDEVEVKPKRDVLFKRDYNDEDDDEDEVLEMIEQLQNYEEQLQNVFVTWGVNRNPLGHSMWNKTICLFQPLQSQ
jgi:hypothetical protein